LDFLVEQIWTSLSAIGVHEHWWKQKWSKGGRWDNFFHVVQPSL